MLSTDETDADGSVIKVRISTNQSAKAGGEVPGATLGENNTNSVNLDVHMDNDHSSVHIHRTEGGDV